MSAIDAGPGLRDALLARLGELRGLAGEATPGPWSARERAHYVTVYGASGFAVVRTTRFRPPDAVYIAAHHPALTGAVWEGLEAEVRRHEEGTVAVPTFDQFDSPTQRGCLECGTTYCGFVARWASLLGVGGAEGPPSAEAASPHVEVQS